MTTETISTPPTMRQLLAELATVTRARRDNWNGGEAPRDHLLELEHQNEIERIRQAIAKLETPAAISVGTSLCQ